MIYITPRVMQAASVPRARLCGGVLHPPHIRHKERRFTYIAQACWGSRRRVGLGALAQCQCVLYAPTKITISSAPGDHSLPNQR